MMVSVMLQFSAQWEILVILLLLSLFPLWSMSLFSTSWKSVSFFKEEMNLKSNISNMSAVISTLFLFLLLTNLSGLTPFSFASSSQGWFSIIFSVSLFLVSVVLFFFRGKINFITHLVPTGSPVPLGLVLFWMEIISTMIRPLTLVLRLCANMTAGHVMLGLISGFFVKSVFFPGIMTAVLFICGLVFFLFEVFVAFIQSLVFSLLLINYLDEAA